MISHNRWITNPSLYFLGDQNEAPAGIGAVLRFPLSFTSLFTFFPGKVGSESVLSKSGDP